MPRIRYANLTFKDDSIARIKQADEILGQYRAMGTDCTLRQLYYRFVAKNLIPNNIQEYNKLKALINNARLAGWLDWEELVDRTRFLRGLIHQENPRDAILSWKEEYYLNKWVDQDDYIECWVEKDALIGILDMICLTYDVPYMSCKGYASSSEVWGAAVYRLKPNLEAGKRVTILYLGDHDPSGLDMTRYLRERLALFCGIEGHTGRLKVKRLALNMDQIEEHEPPPNPTKSKDTRTPEYESEFGEDCWELDALDPPLIKGIIEQEILQYRDIKKWDVVVAREQADRVTLERTVENWDRIQAAANPAGWDAWKAIPKSKPKPKKRRKR